ncbi:MAG: DUF488 domain-containing protein [Chloroflexota bacterium]
MPNKRKIITIGVYGFDESTFFDTLKKANVQVFYDIRNRRGMRGSLYSFVNSTYLQKRLQQLSIDYIHLKDLSPSDEIRKVQKASDELVGQTKRQRTALSTLFIQTFKSKILDKFDLSTFWENIPDSVETIALFCVEREPTACHRSIVANRLEAYFDAEVENILPWKY